jgi:hypothetical protein
MRKYSKGDRVKINANYSIYNGREGTIARTTFSEEDAYTVAIDGDTIPERGFYERELDLVGKDDREALITLAETLDSARQQANAIDSAAPQSGVYGKIHVALVDTLHLITEDYEDVYESIMADGNTVRQALTWIEGNK